MPVIEIRGLCKKFERTLAVDHLSFTVDSGTVVGFLGPNGAGKTTTLRALLGLVEPTGGSATISGTVYRDLDHPLASRPAASPGYGGSHRACVEPDARRLDSSNTVTLSCGVASRLVRL